MVITGESRSVWNKDGIFKQEGPLTKLPAYCVGKLNKLAVTVAPRGTGDKAV